MKSALERRQSTGRIRVVGGEQTIRNKDRFEREEVDMNDEKTSTDKLAPDNTEAAPESVPKAKTDPIQDAIVTILLIFLAWGVPVLVWVVMCGGVAVFAADYTSMRAAILIGLLVGSIVIGLLFSGGYTEVERSCCSLMLLIVGFIVLSAIRDFRHRAIQKQRNHTQQERKQNR